MTKRHNFKYDIVCVDDETQITSILSSFMEILYGETDFKMKTYNSPVVAMQEIQSGALSSKVWLLDIMMPGSVNGADLAQELRRRTDNKNRTFIYAYTAIASNAQIMEKYSKEHLFDGTYNKTKTPDTVLQSILSDHLNYTDGSDQADVDDLPDFDSLISGNDVETQMQSGHVLVQEDLPKGMEEADFIEEFSMDDMEIIETPTPVQPSVIDAAAIQPPVQEIETTLIPEPATTSIDEMDAVSFMDDEMNEDLKPQQDAIESIRELKMETPSTKNEKIDSFEDEIASLLDKSPEPTPMVEEVIPSQIVENVSQSPELESTFDIVDFESDTDAFSVSIDKMVEEEPVEEVQDFLSEPVAEIISEAEEVPVPQPVIQYQEPEPVLPVPQPVIVRTPEPVLPVPQPVAVQKPEQIVEKVVPVENKQPVNVENENTLSFFNISDDIEKPEEAEISRPHAESEDFNQSTSFEQDVVERHEPETLVTTPTTFSTPIVPQPIVRPLVEEHRQPVKQVAFDVDYEKESNEMQQEISVDLSAQNTEDREDLVNEMRVDVPVRAQQQSTNEVEQPLSNSPILMNALIVYSMVATILFVVMGVLFIIK